MDNPEFAFLRDEALIEAETDEVVMIKANSSFEGIAKEYQWLEDRFGERDVDWFVESRMTLHENDRVHDQFKIRTRDAENHSVKFDVTSFFGKF